MSLSAEADKVENLEFKWGKKRGVGGKKKEVQFYDSFTYDGVDYILHDCVYMYKEGEPKPYIGKLIKIWENGDKTKKVKVQWFFHPSEILNWLRGEEALPNEIFLASGEGAGVANVNPLEAIAGKCNVVCISKDSRNPQPSEQEIRMADYIFYRTFDVRHCTISDKMDDKVGGLEVKFVFNSKESEMISGAPLDCVKKEEAVACNQTLQLPRQNPPEEFKTPGKGIEKISGVPLASEKKEEAVACNQTLQPSGKNPPEEFKTTKTDGHSNHLVAKGCADLKDSLVKGKPASCAAMDSDDVPTTSGQRGTVSGDKTTRNMNSVHKLTVHENDVKALVTTITYPEGKAKTGPGSGSGSGSGFLGPDRGIKSVKDTGASEDRPSKKARVDSSIKLSENKNNNGVRKASINSDGNNAKDLADTLPSGGKTKSKVASLGWDKDLQPKTDEKMMKLTKSKVSSFGPDKDLQQKTDEKMAKLSNGKLLKVSARETPGDRKTEGEVTRRPDDPWEERLKSTHEQGTLVHLSNLDPEYTSGEVEFYIEEPGQGGPIKENISEVQNSCDGDLVLSCRATNQMELVGAAFEVAKCAGRFRKVQERARGEEALNEGLDGSIGGTTQGDDGEGRFTRLEEALVGPAPAAADTDHIETWWLGMLLCDEGVTESGGGECHAPRISVTRGAEFEVAKCAGRFRKVQERARVCWKALERDGRV
ncbi:hypothetical protein TEA_028967 [Camellia sinensis var. sinensis]|uniref:BAH domain-containing protein n=1 Tax=Camellia sinensis var. sinensis TaxID=542762 RepID=A0A4S4CYX0_CAMSN|nr:hypothetical protein TEA_028967 [Camellia sinensis var. sinensis]